MVTKLACRNCRYFDLVDDPKGICRRRPPVQQGIEVGHWPIVVAEDWCGDYDPRGGAADKKRKADS